MGFPILVRCHLYIESGPWYLYLTSTKLRYLSIVCILQKAVQGHVIIRLECNLPMDASWMPLSQEVFPGNHSLHSVTRHCVGGILLKLRDHPADGFKVTIWGLSTRLGLQSCRTYNDFSRNLAETNRDNLLVPIFVGQGPRTDASHADCGNG